LFQFIDKKSGCPSTNQKYGNRANQAEAILSPEDFGVQQINQEDIFGGNTIEDSANIFLNVIKGNGTDAQNNVVCANAGMAIATVKNLAPIEGFELAKESLMSGKALASLKVLQQLSN